jgi:hypothetical protein
MGGSGSTPLPPAPHFRAAKSLAKSTKNYDFRMRFFESTGVDFRQHFLVEWEEFDPAGHGWCI